MNNTGVVDYDYINKNLNYDFKKNDIFKEYIYKIFPNINSDYDNGYYLEIKKKNIILINIFIKKEKYILNFDDILSISYKNLIISNNIFSKDNTVVYSTKKDTCDIYYTYNYNEEEKVFCKMQVLYNCFYKKFSKKKLIEDSNRFNIILNKTHLYAACYGNNRNIIFFLVNEKKIDVDITCIEAIGVNNGFFYYNFIKKYKKGLEQNIKYNYYHELIEKDKEIEKNKKKREIIEIKNNNKNKNKILKEKLLLKNIKSAIKKKYIYKFNINDNSSYIELKSNIINDLKYKELIKKDYIIIPMNYLENEKKINIKFNELDDIICNILI